MQSFRSFARDWRRPAWVLLLVTASVVFSSALACATPFIALCAVAACTLPRRDAFCVTGGVWAANQVIGFAFLGYPWTASCLGWGAVLGLSALLCVLTARGARRRLTRWHPVASSAAAFAAAFVAFEAALAVSSLALGGTGSFTPLILAQILAINAAAWVGFFALTWAGAFSGLTIPVPPSAS
jgi:hypothetical protein